MPFTYDDLLPTDKDKARAALGDTDMGAPLFSDGHITAVIALRAGLDAGTAQLARELIAKYAHQPVRKSANGISVDYTDRIAAWKEIALGALSAGGAFAVAPPRADGYAEKAAEESA